MSCVSTLRHKNNNLHWSWLKGHHSYSVACIAKPYLKRPVNPDFHIRRVGDGWNFFLKQVESNCPLTVDSFIMLWTRITCTYLHAFLSSEKIVIIHLLMSLMMIILNYMCIILCSCSAKIFFILPWNKETENIRQVWRAQAKVKEEWPPKRGTCK